MKPLPLILALSLSASGVHSRNAAAQSTQKANKPAALAVTRDNFVSLSVETFGGYAGIRSSTTITSSGITQQDGRPGGGGGFGAAPAPSARPVPMSSNQLGALIRLLNSAKVPALVGKYEDKNLRDGFSETVTLTISDAANRDRTFAIQSYGQKAPREYYTFMRRLREFVALKLPRASAAAQPATARR